MSYIFLMMNRILIANLSECPSSSSEGKVMNESVCLMNYPRQPIKHHPIFISHNNDAQQHQHCCLMLNFHTNY